jgi:hypothetical protein
MSTVNSGLWERLHKGLEKLAEEKHHQDLPTVKLVIGILISAGKDRDMFYLHSDQFLYHCYLAGMDSNYVAKMIERAWYFIDNNIPILPETEEEDDNQNDEEF